jgi:hypothetical protein
MARELPSHKISSAKTSFQVPTILFRTQESSLAFSWAELVVNVIAAREPDSFASPNARIIPELDSAQNRSRHRNARVVRHSCAVKDSGQLTRVFAFAVEGAADCGEGLGERENVARDQEIGILRADRMPVHAIGRNGNFRH